MERRGVDRVAGSNLFGPGVSSQVTLSEVEGLPDGYHASTPLSMTWLVRHESKSAMPVNGRTAEGFFPTLAGGCQDLLRFASDLTARVLTYKKINPDLPPYSSAFNSPCVDTT